jgi:hypothetical protein
MARRSDVGWPTASERRDCVAEWQKATAEERRYISCLKCAASVRYLYVSEELLARRLSRAGREAFRLEGLGWWSIENPQMLMLGEALCAAADAMAFMLKCCARTVSECREILQQAKSGRIAIDSAENVLLSGRCSSWEEHAREVYTLILHEMLQRRDRASWRKQCLANVHAALEGPRPSQRRSWPSKSELATLQAEWTELSTEERLEASAIAAGFFWFVQACDVALVARALKHADLADERADRRLLRKAREASRLLMNLEVTLTGERQITLLSEFVASPDCLELLQQKAVRHVKDKENLVSLALTISYEDLVSAGSPCLMAGLAATWLDLERIVATVLLENLVQRTGLMSKLRAEMRAREVQDAERAAAVRHAAQQRRKCRKQAELRALQQARAQAAAAREDERRRIVALLAAAPSWPFESWFGVKWTFVHVKVQPEDWPSECDLGYASDR